MLKKSYSSELWSLSFSSISRSRAAVFTGFAEPKMDDEGTEEAASSTGKVRGWSWSFGLSVSSGALGASAAGAGASLAGSVDLVQAFSLK